MGGFEVFNFGLTIFQNITVQYLHSYEKTIKLGQTDKDGTLYDVTTITLYDGSYMGIKIYSLDDLDMIFAVR